MTYQNGDVVTWAYMTHARQPNNIPIPITYIEDYQSTKGPADTLAYIKQQIQTNQIIKAGPLPMLPYWWPVGKQGSDVPDSLQGGALPVTRQLLLDLPHTFVRKTRFITDVQASFYLQQGGPNNTINDIVDSRLDASGVDQYNNLSYGWQNISYSTQDLQSGTYYSCWLFWLDGQMVSALIPHSKIDDPATLIRYWKPEDIWNNVIKPRIDQDMEIIKMGSTSPNETPASEPLEIGAITNTSYIQACSYLWPWPGLGLEGDLDSFTATFAAANHQTENDGDYYQVYPGLTLPNMGKALRTSVDSYAGNLRNYLRARGNLSDNTTNCLSLINNSGKPPAGGVTSQKHELWFMIDPNANVLDYRVRSLAASGNHIVQFKIPDNCSSIDALYMVGFSNADFSDQSITFSYFWGLQGEQVDANAADATPVNLSGATDEFFRWNQLLIMSGAGDWPPQAGDFVSLKITHNGIGTTLNYIGLYMIYTD